MREYEFTIVANAQLPEQDSHKVIEKYEKLILGETGALISKKVWGVRKLAYPIKKHFRGLYVNYDLTADAENLAEAERLMRIDDNVLRYLAIKVGEDVDVEQRKIEIAKEEARAAAAAASSQRDA